MSDSSTMLSILAWDSMPARIRCVELVPAANTSSCEVKVHITLDGVEPEERHWEGARATARRFGLDVRHIDWVLTGGEGATRAFGYFHFTSFVDDGN